MVPGGGEQITRIHYLPWKWSWLHKHPREEVTSSLSGWMICQEIFPEKVIPVQGCGGGDVLYLWNPSIRRLQQEEEMFRVLLSSLVNLRALGAAWDPVSKTKRKEVNVLPFVLRKRTCHSPNSEAHNNREQGIKAPVNEQAGFHDARLEFQAVGLHLPNKPSRII